MSYLEAPNGSHVRSFTLFSAGALHRIRGAVPFSRSLGGTGLFDVRRFNCDPWPKMSSMVPGLLDFLTQGVLV